MPAPNDSLLFPRLTDSVREEGFLGASWSEHEYRLEDLRPGVGDLVFHQRGRHNHSAGLHWNRLVADPDRPAARDHVPGFLLSVVMVGRGNLARATPNTAKGHARLCRTFPR